MSSLTYQKLENLIIQSTKLPILPRPSSRNSNSLKPTNRIIPQTFGNPNQTPSKKPSWTNRKTHSWLNRSRWWCWRRRRGIWVWLSPNCGRPKRSETAHLASWRSGHYQRSHCRSSWRRTRTRNYRESTTVMVFPSLWNEHGWRTKYLYRFEHRFLESLNKIFTDLWIKSNEKEKKWQRNQRFDWLIIAFE